MNGLTGHSNEPTIRVELRFIIFDLRFTFKIC